LLKRLLRQGAEPNFETENSVSPFHEAIYSNSTLGIIKTFMEADLGPKAVDPFRLNSEKLCALHYFALVGSDPAILDCFLRGSKESVDVRGGQWGSTPLHFLSTRIDIPIPLLEAFLNAEANVNIEDSDSESEFHVSFTLFWNIARIHLFCDIELLASFAASLDLLTSFFHFCRTPCLGCQEWKYKGC
jgi:ankyrin repeat protein